MGLSGVRVIFFDAVGTLIHPDPPAPEVYARVGQGLGSRSTVETVTIRFSEAFDRQERLDWAGGLETSEEREYRRWQEVVAQVLDDVKDSDACFRQLHEHFRHAGAWRLDPEAAVVLEQLADWGLLLGLASNFDRRLRDVVAGLPGLRRMGRLVISSEVGWRKPAPEFFAAVLRQAGVPGDQVLLVGDDLTNDYRGARSAGLRAVLVDPHHRLSADVARIRRLPDLLTTKGNEW
jgi:putative hydrolase of the HAD superfamily